MCNPVPDRYTQIKGFRNFGSTRIGLSALSVECLLCEEIVISERKTDYCSLWFEFFKHLNDTYTGSIKLYLLSKNDADVFPVFVYESDAEEYTKVDLAEPRRHSAWSSSFA